jgi:hypothetical protein
MTTWEYDTEADNKVETKQMKQFPKPVIHYPTSTKDPHLHALAMHKKIHNA